MISRPHVGQPVQLWYAAARRAVAPLHGRIGRVVAAAGVGRGPRNHLVNVDGSPVVVPAGNLRNPEGGGE